MPANNVVRLHAHAANSTAINIYTRLLVTYRPRLSDDDFSLEPRSTPSSLHIYTDCQLITARGLAGGKQANVVLIAAAAARRVISSKGECGAAFYNGLDRDKF